MLKQEDFKLNRKLIYLRYPNITETQLKESLVYKDYHFYNFKKLNNDLLVYKDHFCKRVKLDDFKINGVKPEEICSTDSKLLEYGIEPIQKGKKPLCLLHQFKDNSIDLFHSNISEIEAKEPSNCTNNSNKDILIENLYKIIDEKNKTIENQNELIRIMLIKSNKEESLNVIKQNSIQVQSLESMQSINIEPESTFLKKKRNDKDSNSSNKHDTYEVGGTFVEDESSLELKPNVKKELNKEISRLKKPRLNSSNIMPSSTNLYPDAKVMTPKKKK